MVTDESDPLFMGADGHSNNTAELQAIAEALLWLKDTERGLSPVLFCLDSEYAASAVKGPARCIKTLCKSKRASSCISKKLVAGQVGSPSLTFQATERFLGTSERMSLRREVRPTSS